MKDMKQNQRSHRVKLETITKPFSAQHIHSSSSYIDAFFSHHLLTPSERYIPSVIEDRHTYLLGHDLKPS